MPGAALARIRLACLFDRLPASARPPTPTSSSSASRSGPNNLDPRIGTDDVSQKIGAADLQQPDDARRAAARRARSRRAARQPGPDRPTSCTLRRGVQFHDGHELTSADVVYTFRSLLDPDVRLAAQGRVPDARSRSRRAIATRSCFTLKEPFGSFPVNLVHAASCPTAPGRSLREHPIGTGPYRFVQLRGRRPARARRVRRLLRRTRRRTTASCCKIVPDDIMRGPRASQGHDRHRRQRSRAGHRRSARARPAVCSSSQSPGVDYQYIGLNLRDPMLKDVRVRQAIGYAIDRAGDHRVPAPRAGDPSDGHPAADVVGLRSRRVHVHVRSRAGPRAARRSRLPRSGRRRSGDHGCT